MIITYEKYDIDYEKARRTDYAQFYFRMMAAYNDMNSIMKLSEISDFAFKKLRYRTGSRYGYRDWTVT